MACLDLSGQAPLVRGKGSEMSEKTPNQPQKEIEEKINLLQRETRLFLSQIEDFYASLQQQSLFRKVVFHKQKTGLEKFGAEFADLYIPNFRWVEYIGDKRIYLNWEHIAIILNRVNATLDERIFHIQMNYEFRRLRLEVKSAVNRLKDLIILSQKFLQQLEEQRISSKMFNKLSA